MEHRYSDTYKLRLDHRRVETQTRYDEAVRAWNERDTTNDALFDNGAMPGGLPLDGQAAPDLLQQAGEEQVRETVTDGSETELIPRVVSFRSTKRPQN